MQAAVKLTILIPPDRRVEITFPEELPPGPAEVIVLTSSQDTGQRPPRPMGLDVGKGWVAEDFDAPLPQDLQELFEGKS